MPSEFPKTVAETDFYVCVGGPDIVGFGFLSRRDAEVGAVFVDPAVQRRGIGRRILSTLEDAAMKAGLTRLRVVASLNAESFYASTGFQSQGSGTWHHPNGFDLPCVNMWKDLAVKQFTLP
jgi:GNAT superfamily N-acetyltransferase